MSKSAVIDRSDIYSEAKLTKQMSAIKENDITLAENGRLMFSVIVYPDNLDAIEFDENGEYDFSQRYRVELKNSALFLKNALEKMTGDKAELLSQSKYKGEKAIILTVDEGAKVSRQGYVLDISTESITIASVFEQGVTNGIFSFLEDCIGCMFPAPDFDYIPRLSDIHLSKAHISDEPEFMWRSVYTQSSEKVPNLYRKNDYLGWHSKLKLNGAGGDDLGNGCHSSFSYIPPEEYYKTHPEYFSLYRGRRVYKQGPVSGQLCWTNEDVYKIISQKLFRQMEENPDVHIWDVSQMDTWINRGVGCQCKKCREIDKREGSQMGSLLTFINRLADECAERFPNNYISTLAYNYTVDPPKNIRPRKNVLIKLCLMPGNAASDYANPNEKWARKAHEVVAKWGKIADNIMIWDYNVDYHGYFIPFPLINSMSANNSFYKENNVYAIFHQMAYETRAQDAELHAYLFSKLMWNRNTDVKKLAGKYMDIYYADAAPYIAKYYCRVHENIQKYGQPLYIYAQPDAYRAGYLSDRCLKEYAAILDDALDAVKDDEELTKRVRRERLGILYAKAKKISFDKKGRKAALDEFYEICKENGIIDLIEGKHNYLDEFYKKTDKEIRTIISFNTTTSVAISQAIKFGFSKIMKKIIKQ
ncbi:MAG: DUF4838 domain-containing protein [Eubacterium sp.]